MTASRTTYSILTLSLTASISSTSKSSTELVTIRASSSAVTTSPTRAVRKRQTPTILALTLQPFSVTPTASIHPLISVVHSGTHATATASKLWSACENEGASTPFFLPQIRLRLGVRFKGILNASTATVGGPDPGRDNPDRLPIPNKTSGNNSARANGHHGPSAATCQCSCYQ